MMATPTRTLRRSLSPEAVMAEDAERKPVHTRIEDGPPYWSSVATPSPPPRRPTFAKQRPTMPTPLQDGPPYWSSLYNVLSPSPTPETPPSTRSGKLHHQGSEASATHETPMTPPLLKHQKRAVPRGEEHLQTPPLQKRAKPQQPRTPSETKPVHTRIEDGPPYWSSVATPSPPPRRPSFAKQCPTMPTPLQDGPPYWSSLYNVLSPSPTPETPPSTRSGKFHRQGSEASETHETPMTPPLLKHQKRVVPQGEESGA